VAEALAMAIDFEDGLECVGMADSVARARELATERLPDVVLMDVQLSDGSGLEATAELKGILPDVSVIVLTAHSDPVYRRGALDAGAAGLLVKGTRMTEIMAAIRRAAAGEQLEG
jgi:DNA-binding NarL/FixJ family response regulator